MVTQDDYAEQKLDACRSVLIELVHLLGDFKNEIAIVGGWVPQLLLPNSAEAHVGTLDIDLACDFENISDDTYNTLLKLLTDRGYRQSGKQPFIFYREVSTQSGRVVVQVDFLSGEYGGSSKSRRTQEVQDIRARKARGCDLVFGRTVNATISGFLPGGGVNEVTCKIAGIVPFLVMKSMALSDRIKEKDAYDIEYVLRFYPGGVAAVAEAFIPLRDHGLVKEALQKLGAKFGSPDHVGPRWIADFLGIIDREERIIRQRQAHQVVDSFLLLFNDQ